jgi:hypothetical protein
MLFMVDWDYHLLCSACCLWNLSYRVNIYFIHIKHARKRLISRRLPKRFQDLAVTSFVQLHNNLILVIILINLLHLMILVAPIPNHVQTTIPVIVLTILLMISFMNTYPHIFISTEITFSLVVLVLNQTVFGFIRVNWICCSAITLKITK